MCSNPLGPAPKIVGRPAVTTDEPVADSAAAPCAPLPVEIGYSEVVPSTPPVPPPSEPPVRGVLGQVMAAVQEFWWGYWQAPPGC